MGKYYIVKRIVNGVDICHYGAGMKVIGKWCNSGKEAFEKIKDKNFTFYLVWTKPETKPIGYYGEEDGWDENGEGWKGQNKDERDKKREEWKNRGERRDFEGEGWRKGTKYDKENPEEFGEEWKSRLTKTNSDFKIVQDPEGRFWSSDGKILSKDEVEEILGQPTSKVGNQPGQKKLPSLNSIGKKDLESGIDKALDSNDKESFEMYSKFINKKHPNLKTENKKMSKVIRLDENDIEKLVRKIIREGDSDRSQLYQEGVNEAWPQRELDRKETNFRRGDFDPYKREKGVQSIFGKYSEDVPPTVIQYMRKNPAAIIKRLVDIYGLEKVYNYIDKANGEEVTENYKFEDIISKKNKHSK